MEYQNKLNQNHGFVDDLFLSITDGVQNHVSDFNLPIKNQLLSNLLYEFSYGTSIPTPYLLGSILTVLSGAIGKSKVININDAKKHYLNLYTVLIGKSGIAKKSSAIEEVTEPLLEINAKLLKQYQQKIKVYEESIQGSSDSEEVTPPKQEQFIFYSDTSTEGLIKALASSSRGIMIDDELGGFLQHAKKKYASDLKLKLTRIYSNPGDIGQSRTDQSNKVIAKRPYLSLLGASTKEGIFLNSDIQDFHTGFFARMNFIYLDDNTKEYVPLVKFKNNSQLKPKNKLGAILFRIINDNENVELKLSSEASEFHSKFDIELNNRMKEAEELESIIIERVKTTALKISGILAILDARYTIESVDMEDAITISNYFLESSIEFANEFRSKGVNKPDKTQKILRVLENKAGETERSVLLQNTKLRAAEFDPHVEKLIEQNIVEKYEKDVGNKNGSKITMYRLVKVN